VAGAVIGCRFGYEPLDRSQGPRFRDDGAAGSEQSAVDTGAGGGYTGSQDGAPVDDDARPNEADQNNDVATFDEAADAAEAADASTTDLVVDLSNPAKMILNGSAVIAGSELDLTTGQLVQAGSAYLPDPYPIGPNTVFSIFFTFRLYGGGDGGTGGDGITLIWQNAPAGTAALGGAGSALGYEPSITPSVDVRVRTARTTAEDPSDNYVAINQGGTRVVLVANTMLPFDLNDGLSHNMWVDYSGPARTITAYLGDSTTKPSTPTLTGNVDLAMLVGSTAYLGFTGATGGLTNIQAIEAMTVHYQY
jgi:hypothetical protein